MNVQKLARRKLVSVLILLALMAGTLGATPRAALAAAPGQGDPGSFYYYANGQRVPLQVSLKWAAVKFADTSPRGQAQALASAHAPLDAAGARRDLPGVGLTLVPVAAGTSPQALVSSLQSMRGMTSRFKGASPVFEAQNSELMLNDEFIASFDPAMSRAQVDAINARHGVEAVRELLGQPNTFLMRLPAGSPADALQMANLYQEGGEALAAEPNFVLRMAPDPALSVRTGPATSLFTTPNDAMYSDQWALNNTQQYGTWMAAGEDINAPEAWGLTTGEASVVIAVIDEGVELTHEDLSAKLVAGYDATGGGSGGAPCSAPCGTYDDGHGTAVAGIAAAVTNNGYGVAGVCPSCSIMPVRVATGDGAGYWITSNAILADGISWAWQHGAAVLNLSWMASSSTVVTNAINNARSQGRGGLGAVVVAAAGNNGTSPVYFPASLSNVIAVGALNLCNARKTKTYDQCNVYENYWGSNYGTALDLVAPGVWLDTSDRMGSAGYNTTAGVWGNYIDYFNGTSGATPLVAGTAGLVLSMNPYLSAAQVQSIMQSYATDIAPAGRDNQTGYGRVNAYAAVNYAKSLLPNVGVDIGPAKVGLYQLAVGASQRQSYTNVDAGPVQVQYLQGYTPIIASERINLKLNTGYSSYSEFMGVPGYQLSDTYIFPWYNNATLGGLASELHFANVGTATTTVTISIAGTPDPTTYTLDPNTSQTVTYTDIDNGPVMLQSSDNVPIVASERIYLKAGKGFDSYTELMGLSASSTASTRYMFPWYNNATWGGLDSQLRFGNIGTADTLVTVKIGGVVQGTYPLSQSASTRISYTNVDAGPVEITSSDNVPIIASQRINLKSGKGFDSYTELMGLPVVGSRYVFPIYTNTVASGLEGQLRFGNLGGDNTTVYIKIGGVEQATSYNLAPNESQRISFTDLDNQPIEVYTKDLTPIIASMRVNMRPSVDYSSFAEFMGMSIGTGVGLPGNQLSWVYRFPWYNNATWGGLDSQLRFGIP